MKWKILVATLLTLILLGSALAFGQDGELMAPEQQAMADTVQNALENNKSNQSADWVNPDSGNSGGVTPVRTFTGPQGQPCREFISTIIIGGQEQQGYGTACRQPDGSWQIVADAEDDYVQSLPKVQADVYLHNRPSDYYIFPSDLYYPNHIFLSFAYVYRGDRLYRGDHFLDGRTFRRHYPLHIKSRVLITPRDSDRYYRMRSWWGYRERKVERERKQERYEDRRGGWDWRDRDRGNQPWNNRGRGRKNK